MPHPRMYHDADVLLERLRGICLALPEAREKESHGRPNFFAGKVFAVYGSHVCDTALIVKPDPSERRALETDGRFFVPPYYGPSGWLGLDLAPADTDWQEVAELVEDSYRQIALKRMLRVLDAQPGTTGV